uniref:Zgc:173545 n=1 Tax=Astyanax mexicanus TaxID=7994 RepID=A0A3B1KAA4_ASTMX
MWKRNQLHILTVATTLSSAAFCLHTIPTKPQERVIRHGTIFVGNQRKFFSNETKGGAGDLGDTDGYQADQPEAEVGYTLAEQQLHQLRPSVQCDNDSMTLRMLGKRVPDFLVERDGKTPVPLSEMPADCGLSVKRARRDIFLVAKYDGCHMTQEGDNYILPLRLWGVPVKMGCPVEALFLTVSCTLSAMVIQVGNSVDSLKVKVNGEWQPLAQACDTCGFTLEAVPSEWIVTAPYTSKCWQIEGEERLLSVLYSNGEVTLSCPLDTTPLPTDEELPPVHPIPPVEYPFPYPGNQFWPFYLGYPGTPPRSPTTATTTGTSPTAPAATVTPPSADDDFWNPYGHGRNWLFYPGYPGYSGTPLRSPTSGPATPATTTTTATTTTNPTTTAATTAKPSVADDRFWNRYGHGRNWLFYPGYPGYSGPPPKSATPASATPALTTTTASTTTNPSTAATIANPPGSDERFWNPYGHARNWLFYPGYPGYFGPPSQEPHPWPNNS